MQASQGKKTAMILHIKQRFHALILSTVTMIHLILLRVAKISSQKKGTIHDLD